MNEWLDRRLHVLALDELGLSYAEIARASGCNWKTVKKWLKEEGRERDERREVTLAEIHEVARRTVAGESAREIGRHMGRAVPVVLRAREKAGVAGPARLYAEGLAERVREIRRLREQGMSFARIGEYVGLPASGVQYHCLRHGIEKGGAR